ncbi:MAG: sulfurtransferase TusA family protein [Chloroflexi bacterium]|nr:sulfurtransferase TusA family protein [Chloroflexota bacterium]
MAEVKVDKIVDTKGQLCPMPVVRAKLAIEDMQPGQVLRVLATDPASPKDFVAWCQETGNKLISNSKEGGTFVFIIEKG